VPENLLDHLGLAALDEGDFEFGPAPRTAKRIRFVNLLDERCPAFAGFAGARWPGANSGFRGRPRLPLAPLPAGLVRMPPVVAACCPNAISSNNALARFRQEFTQRLAA